LSPAPAAPERVFADPLGSTDSPPPSAARRSSRISPGPSASCILPRSTRTTQSRSFGNAPSGLAMAGAGGGLEIGCRAHPAHAATTPAPQKILRSRRELTRRHCRRDTMQGLRVCCVAPLRPRGPGGRYLPPPRRCRGRCCPPRWHLLLASVARPAAASLGCHAPSLHGRSRPERRSDRARAALGSGAPRALGCSR